jgi:hypothetical protein
MTAVPARQESAVTVAVAVVVPATSVVAAEAAAAGADRAAAAGVAKGVAGPSGYSWSVLRASW